MEIFDIVLNVVRLMSCHNNELRLVSKVFCEAYDHQYKWSWNYKKICINSPHMFDNRPDIADVEYVRIQPWVVSKIQAHHYYRLLHTRTSLKMCFTMRGMLVRTDELHKLNDGMLRILNWTGIINYDFNEEIISEYLSYIDDWDNVKIIPPISLIQKCNNLSMMKYLDKSLNIYPHLNRNLLIQFADYLNWNKIAKFTNSAEWLDFANNVNWNEASLFIFSNDDNASYINWDLYSIMGLSDADFIKRANLINIDAIQCVCVSDIKILDDFMRDSGYNKHSEMDSYSFEASSDVKIICVNAKIVTYTKK